MVQLTIRTSTGTIELTMMGRDEPSMLTVSTNQGRERILVEPVLALRILTNAGLNGHTIERREYPD
jgi:hypothetical protein